MTPLTHASPPVQVQQYLCCARADCKKATKQGSSDHCNTIKYRFCITWNMPETTPSPLPTIRLTIANLAVKVNAEVSNQEEGGKGAGHLVAVLLLICYVVAVSLPCLFPAVRSCGQAMPCIASASTTRSNGVSVWGAVLSTSLNDSNFNNQDIFERPWNKGLFCMPLDCFWLLATSNKLLGNKKQMENNRSNYIAGWMFHFKYYCLCEDIQHGCVIAKRNMHWSLYQETGMTVLCKYYFIYCQQL